MDTQERSLGGLGVVCSAIVALMVLGAMEPTLASEDDTAWHAGPELAWVDDPSGDFATTTRRVSFGARLHDLEFWRSAFGGKSSGVSADNNVRWGRMTGIDLPLGENGWLIQANFRYMDTDIRASRGAFTIDHKRKPDLRVFSIGFGYRF